MTTLKRIFALMGGMLLGIIILIILAPLVGFDVAIISLGSIMIIYFGIRLGIPYLNTRRGNQDAILYPATDDLPDILVDADIELHLLGFVQIGRFKHNKNSHEQFSYLYNDRTIMAFVITLNEKVYVNICSYLDDGFAINTDFRGIVSTNSENGVRHIVDSDIETAFDYHEHQVSQYVAQHGNPKVFNTLQEVLDWEDQYQMRQNSYQDAVQYWKQAGLRLIGVITLQAILMVTIFNVVGDFNFSPLVTIVTMVIPFIIILIASILWAIRPIMQQTTVEQRKKKEVA